VFAKDDPIVRGQIALLRACTQEDVPAETGWLWHDSIWNYNASFAAHVYLWAGLPALAERTFHGFLNHASPLYCWLEEQPLQHALVGQDWGDMPHNWASAECIRYLRHRLVLEDDTRLRLLEGIVGTGIRTNEICELDNTPTRFGRLSVKIETAPKICQVEVNLDFRKKPTAVHLPLTLGGKNFDRVQGANFQLNGSSVFVDPAARQWRAFWR
jgi:hypothetical protein